MKAIKLTSLFLLSMVFISCNSQNSDQQSRQNSTQELSENIQVYYFHNTKRCATCNAVENETKITLETFYKNKLEEGIISFTSLNLEEQEGLAKAKELGVAGQTLLIIKGSEKVNLTNEGFMNARTNPEQFHKILKEQVDKLI